MILNSGFYRTFIEPKKTKDMPHKLYASIAIKDFVNKNRKHHQKCL